MATEQPRPNIIHHLPDVERTTEGRISFFILSVSCATLWLLSGAD